MPVTPIWERPLSVALFDNCILPLRQHVLRRLNSTNIPCRQEVESNAKHDGIPGGVHSPVHRCPRG
jgi:hypothetical protein